MFVLFFHSVYKKIFLQHLCGTDPHPVQFRAKKYKLEQRFMEKKDFMEMMQVTLQGKIFVIFGSS